MDIIEAIKTRRSIRLFKSKTVPRTVIESILEDSRWSPSASNTQPWEILVLGGRVLADFKKRLDGAVKAQPNASPRGNPDIPYPEWLEPYKSRASDTRFRLSSRRVPSPDKLVQLNQPGPAYLYGAPAALIIYTDKSICPKAILDIGMLSQTISLAAMARGLGICMMTYGVSHPEIIREMFGVAESKLIALCIAIGYPETEAETNTFERNREPVNDFTRWYGI